MRRRQETCRHDTLRVLTIDRQSRHTAAARGRLVQSSREMMSHCRCSDNASICGLSSSNARRFQLVGVSVCDRLLSLPSVRKSICRVSINI